MSDQSNQVEVVCAVCGAKEQGVPREDGSIVVEVTKLIDRIITPMRVVLARGQQFVCYDCAVKEAGKSRNEPCCMCGEKAMPVFVLFDGPGREAAEGFDPVPVPRKAFCTWRCWWLYIEKSIAGRNQGPLISPDRN